MSVRRVAARLHAGLYRLTRGRLGTHIGGQPVLLLETVGRRTGRRRTTPVQYLAHGDAYVVVAANAGGPRPPAWSLNLQADPRARVTVGARTVDVVARPAVGDEGAALWRQLTTADHHLQRAAEKAGRELPVVMLEARTPMNRPPDARPEPVEEAMASLVESAVLAPSSHNTQPWLFHLRDEGLELLADRTRALPVNDPHDRELTISCGAALLNLRVAADRAGHRLELALLPDGDDADVLARATLRETSATSLMDNPLFAAIRQRRTYRKPFAERDVPGDLVAALDQAAAAERAWVQVLPGADARGAFVELVGEGDPRAVR